MKIFSLLSALILLTNLQVSAQCCSTETSHCEFQKLADNSGFKKDHDNPKSYSYQGKGKMLTYAVANGEKANAFEIRDSANKQWVIMIHEWWGLNDYIKKEAEAYAAVFKVNVLALDLYDGKVATKREDAAKLMQSAKEERIKSIIKSSFTYLDDAKFAVVGWCFGGGWSLQTAILAGDRAKACIIYYGMPEKDVEQLNQLKAPVLGIWAAQDAWINKEVVTSFEKNMKTAGKVLRSKTYDADHAFANPSNPKFNKVASAQAFSQVESFLEQYFLPSGLEIPDVPYQQPAK